MSSIDEKYIEELSTLLPNFRKVREGVYRFDCVFCENSKTNNKRWSRRTNVSLGYLYFKGYSYNYCCHKCNHRRSLKNILKELNPDLFQQYESETSQDVFPPNIIFSSEHLRIISKGK